MTERDKLINRICAAPRSGCARCPDFEYLLDFLLNNSESAIDICDVVSLRKGLRTIKSELDKAVKCIHELQEENEQLFGKLQKAMLEAEHYKGQAEALRSLFID